MGSTENLNCKVETVQVKKAKDCSALSVADAVGRKDPHTNGDIRVERGG